MENGIRVAAFQLVVVSFGIACEASMLCTLKFIERRRSFALHNNDLSFDC